MPSFSSDMPLVPAYRGRRQVSIACMSSVVYHVRVQAQQNASTAPTGCERVMAAIRISQDADSKEPGTLPAVKK